MSYGAKERAKQFSRGSAAWAVRVYLGRHPETGAWNEHNKTIRGPFRELKTYVRGQVRGRDIGRLPRGAAMRLDRYLDQ